MNILNIRSLWSKITVLVVSVAISGSLSAVDSTQDDNTLQILAFGDSLTAGYGLGPGDGFTDQLQVWLNENSQNKLRVINGGVSGDTTSGGRSRLDWALSPIKNGRPDLVLLELGGNDGLRGVDPAITRENLEAMVRTLTERGISVMLLGMMAPPNLGPDYATGFDSIFQDLSTKYNTGLYPFFLEGVAADPSLNQSDGIHPTKEGVKIIVSKIGPAVLEYLASPH